MNKKNQKNKMKKNDNVKKGNLKFEDSGFPHAKTITAEKIIGDLYIGINCIVDAPNLTEVSGSVIVYGNFVADKLIEVGKDLEIYDHFDNNVFVIGGRLLTTADVVCDCLKIVGGNIMAGGMLYARNLVCACGMVYVNNGARLNSLKFADNIMSNRSKIELPSLKYVLRVEFSFKNIHAPVIYLDGYGTLVVRDDKGKIAKLNIDKSGYNIASQMMNLYLQEQNFVYIDGRLYHITDYTPPVIKCCDCLSMNSYVVVRGDGDRQSIGNTLKEAKENYAHKYGGLDSIKRY